MSTRRVSRKSKIEKAALPFVWQRVSRKVCLEIKRCLWCDGGPHRKCGSKNGTIDLFFFFFFFFASSLEGERERERAGLTADEEGRGSVGFTVGRQRKKERKTERKKERKKERKNERKKENSAV